MIYDTVYESNTITYFYELKLLVKSFKRMYSKRHTF